ncbi:hypothetical protein D3C71_1339140 [compost metagenome]
MAWVAHIAANGGAGAARARAHHNPARDRVRLARHLREHALGNVVVAAPVGGPLGISELVHVVAAGFGGNGAGRVVHRARAVHEVATPAMELDLRNFFGRRGARHDRHKRQPQQPRKVGFAHCGGAARRLDDGRALMHPAIAQCIQKQRPCQPVLEAACGVGGFVLEVQVNAMHGKGRHAQWDQVRVGAALVVGFDAGDGFVEPGGSGGLFLHGLHCRSPRRVTRVVKARRTPGWPLCAGLVPQGSGVRPAAAAARHGPDHGGGCRRH